MTDRTADLARNKLLALGADGSTRAPQLRNQRAIAQMQLCNVSATTASTTAISTRYDVSDMALFPPAVIGAEGAIREGGTGAGASLMPVKI